MMKLRKGLAMLLGATFLMGSAAVVHDAQATELTLGTLAPKKSDWGKVFSVWAKAVKKKTDGAVTLKWYFNSAQGGEVAMTSKMRSGQLDGAAVTAVGLSQFYKNILIMQSPGLFDSWNDLDRTRDALMSDFQSGLNSNGAVLLGVGDVGEAHFMSKGKAVRSPDDLKTMKVHIRPNDPIGETTASTIGYTGIAKGIPALLPALTSGQINAITVPSLAARALQWGPEMEYINDGVAGHAIGGLILSKSSLDGLPSDAREVLVKTGKKAGAMLTKRIRKQDKKAYKALSKRMTVVKLDGGEKARWSSTFKKIRRNLGQGPFPASLMSKVEGLAGK